MTDSYPKAAYFLAICELLERFSFYGMQSLLVLYFINGLGINETQAKSYFHIFITLLYVIPLLGAIAADSWLEKFKTILIMSAIYTTGNVLLNLTTVDALHFPKFWLSMVSLIIIALGCGAIKSCYTAFLGDQFKLPEQEQLMSKFFLIFYFSINVGSFVSTLLCPTLKNLKCFGQENCYPLAFLPSSTAIVLFFVLFVAAKPSYNIKGKPQGNIFILVTKCIFHAMGKKCCSGEKMDHWLDHAKDKYGSQTVDDIKMAISVLWIFVPIPIFWALFYQQSSDWIILAARLDGDLGFVTIFPEQMQAVNPASIIILIPLFHSVIYPYFDKIHFCDTPLKRMCYGGILPVISFILAALLHVAERRQLPPLPHSGMFQLRGYNPQNMPVSVNVEGIEEFSSFQIPPFGFYENLKINLKGTKSVKFNGEEISVSEGNAYGIYTRGGAIFPFKDYIEKPNDGYPRVRTLLDKETDLLYVNQGKGKNVNIEKADYTEKLVDCGSYKIDGINEELQFKAGGVYAILVDTGSKQLNVIVLLKENTISILWLLPQILIMSFSEIMVSVTGIEFAYSQAPSTMKSFLQACFDLTTAIGNFIVVIVTTYIQFNHPAFDAGLYAILMFLDVLLLILMARKYKYKTAPSADSTTQE